MNDESKSAEDMRCEIMRHAMELFAHYGYSKTNIGDIAKACHMSPGNLYRYFRNKQGIGEAVVQTFMDEEEAAIDAALANPDLNWEGRLRHLILYSAENLIREYRETPKMIELADMIFDGDSGILLRHIEWKHAMVAAQLNEGVRLGELSLTHDETYQAACTMLDSVRAFLMPKALEQTDLDTVPERVDAILEVLIAGMKKGR